MGDQSLRAIKGTRDILPDEAWRWQELERRLREFLPRYGYREIRTPVFERTELFARGVGTETDIVSKEMYTFPDMSGTSVTLKPELTAPVIRAYLQNHLERQAPLTKLYYLDAAFRQERPQAGRYRQFHQYGVEAIGSSQPELDAEVLAVAYFSLRDLGVHDLTLHLNSIGSPESRVRYRAALRAFLQPHAAKLSETSRRRLAVNPLRILDTKLPHEIDLLRDAPAIGAYLTDDDTRHYESVKKLLAELEIPFTEDPALVRGLDYYTRTTFEITSPVLGAQNSLCGGGRYDGLVATLGGPPTPGIGFAAGIERILLALEAAGQVPMPSSPDIYLVTPDEAGRAAAPKLLQELRAWNFSADTDYLQRSLKAQLREANRLNVRLVLILGAREAAASTAQVKDLASGEQSAVPLAGLRPALAAALGRSLPEKS